VGSGAILDNRSAKFTAIDDSTRLRVLRVYDDCGVQRVYIKPATPRLNGKVERSHRIDADEFYRLLDGVVLDDARLFTTKLQEWEDFYNFDRPHGGLGGQTPYERLRRKTEARV
jgi:transposase InsO family protein